MYLEIDACWHEMSRRRKAGWLADDGRQAIAPGTVIGGARDLLTFQLYRTKKTVRGSIAATQAQAIARISAGAAIGRKGAT